MSPFPKVEPQKTTKTRKRRTAEIRTDTPVRNSLEEEQEKASLSKVKQRHFAEKEKMVKTKGKKYSKENGDETVEGDSD